MRLFRRRPLPPAPAEGAPAPVTDPFKALVLTRACGPCNGVTGVRRCTCAGHCGARCCKGRPVATDLAGALARITREGSGG